MLASRADRVAAALVAALLCVALAYGLVQSNSERDVDEVVFQNTLTYMSHGEGYYAAMRDALIQKEHAPPSQIRSIRPPTLFVALYRVPVAARRWLVGMVFLSALVLAWRLGRPLATWGGPISVTLVGAWLASASPLLYLHSELWGLPLLLGGIVAMRNERWATAALCLAAAALLRETYLVAFVAGFVWTQDRRWWWPAAAALGVLAALHAWMASSVLAAHGMETAFGASGLGLRYISSAIGPGTEPVAWMLGLAGGALGLYGLTQRWATDRGARVLLSFALVMYPATILVGREYWGLAFASAVACFAPLGGLRLAAQLHARIGPRLRRRSFRAASS